MPTRRVLALCIAAALPVASSAATARAKPLLPVRGREIAVDVRVEHGFIHVAFGFRVKASARRLWRIVAAFRGYPKLIDGLRKVRVKKRGRVTFVTLRGTLLADYEIRTRVRTSFKKGTGVVRWRVEGDDSTSGSMRVEPEGKEAIFSLATRARKEVPLPDFLVELGLRAAIGALGETVRKTIEAPR